MERDISKTQLVDEGNTLEQQKMYNYAQICAIKYMLSKGIIKSPEEFVERFAEPFEMFMSGSLETRQRMDWGKLRQKVKDIQEGGIRKIKSLKIFPDEET